MRNRNCCETSTSSIEYRDCVLVPDVTARVSVEKVQLARVISG